MELSKDDITAFELSVTKLKNELSLAKDEIKTLKTELMSQKFKLHELECDLKEKTRLLKISQSKINMREGFNKELEKQVTQTEIEHKALKHKFKISINTNEQFKNMIQSIETEKNEFKNEIGSLKSEVVKYQKFKEQLIDGNKSIQESVDSIKITIQEMKQEFRVFTKLQSDSEQNKFISENAIMKTVLEKELEEKNLLQEECCYYKALTMQLQGFISDNCTNENKIFFFEKWKEDFAKSQEIIEAIIAHNKLLNETLQTKNEEN